METTTKDVIVKERSYKAPIEKVWNAITDAKEISTWFIQADFKPEIGYHYTFTHDTTKIVGEIQEVSPTHTLRYTWEIEGTGVATFVKWTLREENGQTIVKVEHTGISAYPTEEMTIQMFDNYSNGWINCLDNLGKHVQ